MAIAKGGEMVGSRVTTWTLRRKWHAAADQGVRKNETNDGAAGGGADAHHQCVPQDAPQVRHVIGIDKLREVLKAYCSGGWVEKPLPDHEHKRQRNKEQDKGANCNQT